MNKSLYIIDPRHPAAMLAMCMMALSAIARVIYYAGLDMNVGYAIVYLWMPLLAAIIYIAVVAKFGKTLPMLTIISVVLGVAFFMIKSFTFGSIIHTTLCMILYTAVLVLFSLTMLGIIRTKYLLYPLFFLPLVYHIFVEDMRIYFIPGTTLRDFLPELSVLLIMAALFCQALAMKER